ncbi:MULTISPECIES: hypothetical protein [Streptomycetaceae]|uniref:Uncharacterized protein n=1 Tax=Streptantibioticus cattleyicolor (strain ATCC 35852 / DSM 46488 / JCM 4925 / NBRC 14057 / NRRL 8057) TaxID=1003195 RepID=F8JUL7_STREN|nr:MULTISPECIES: hypothetical protein [Streptomycetaceae]AEW95648.1 hypothetical protein SCATT_32770 [Streptantibioticus cattleyicolor NRRL 8057 = DSM 46488]MYS60193.1 hypothetical protein [Streptomyces sp. SID5468]CCB75982.1 protein of unknown function [Streptantibioticus cattleyicolor NRRL 8057 = DSM 46488]
MTATGQLPEVGDEVMDDGTRAIVTDIRRGVTWLRRPGRGEWPAEDSGRLTVTRTRAERIAAGDA